MIETIKVSSRGQIVIPEQVRKDLHIHEGTKLILVEQGNKLILEKESDFMKSISKDVEQTGWLMLAEKSLMKDWEGEDDVWSKYL
ncbi:MAG TPA: AbrB/MazE/SpoVT family DNA-binding domain-containing protein [Candidatus Nanoarchaeia archaeon]|nr:AbrB/MazE/SpoVT family DNA-binding domain-containing protein [Candidatus Nanoarchaeia archaeon]